MLETIIDSFSVILQLTAVVLALCLIRITRGWKAWTLLASAMVLMAIRRILDLINGVSVSNSQVLTVYDMSGLAISILAVAGMYLVKPLFLSLKRSAAALQESEEKFRSLVNSVDDIVFTLDHAQRLTGVYGRWFEQHQIPVSQILGKTISEILEADASVTLGTDIQRVFAGEFTRFEWHETRILDGSLYFQTSLSPLTDSTGTVVGVVGVARDISRRKHFQREHTQLRTEVEQAKQLAEDMVSVSQRLNCTLDTIIETMPVGVVVCNTDGNFTLSNSAARVMLYGEPTGTAGGPVGNYSLHYHDGTRIPDEELPLVKALTDQVVSYDTEMVVRRMDGIEVVTLVSCSPIYDAESAVIGAVAVLQDITDRKQIENALRQSEATNRTILNAIPDLLFCLNNDDGTLVAEKYGDTSLSLINPSCLLIGRNPGLVEGLVFRVKEAISRTYAEHSLPAFECSVHFAEKQYYFEARAIPCCHGKSLVMARDITERKQAEQALQNSEARFRTIFESAGFAMTTIDKHGYLHETNAVFQELLGYNAEELQGMHFTELTYPDDRGISNDIYQQLATGRLESFQLEKRYLRKGGAVIWGTITVSLVHGGNSESNFAIAIIEDITQRKNDEEAIRDYQTQLRLLTTELTSAEERERRRIAIGMHDHITQALSFSYIEMGALREMVPTHELVEHIDKIRMVIGKAAEDCQSLTFELSPPVLYELGLPAAIEYIAEHFQHEHGISVEVEVTGPRLLPITDDLRALLFRAIQELLVNIVKHASAEEVVISLSTDRSYIYITITDDGQGFEAAQLVNARKTAGGFGLFSIRERLAHIGGTLAIQSAPNRGTEVRMIIPIHSSEEN